jgi:hypothetical protein
MRLEIGRLVGHHRVGRGVGLVEAIPGELLDQVEQLLGLRLRDLMLFGAIDEFRAEFFHLLRFFLAHGAAQDVGLSEGEAGDPVGDRHDLLLVDDHAIGILEQGFQLRHFVGDGNLALLALDEIRDEVHRPGAIEGDDRDDVLEPVGAEAGQEIPHARTFQLEETGRFAGREQGEGLRIGIGDLLDDQRGPVGARPVDQADRVVNHRQGLQAQEVELDEADLFHVSHRILGHDFVVGALVERHVIRERSFGDDDAGGVRGGVAGQPLQRPGDGHQFGDLRFGLGQLAQLRFLQQGVFQRDVELVRHQLGHAVHLGIGNLQHPADVADGRLGAERAERDDLGDVVRAVFLDDVVDDFPAPVHAEVHVDVGERHALRIQEPFEEQGVDERIEIRDAQRIGD